MFGLPLCQMLTFDSRQSPAWPVKLTMPGSALGCAGALAQWKQPAQLGIAQVLPEWAQRGGMTRPPWEPGSSTARQ